MKPRKSWSPLRQWSLTHHRGMRAFAAWPVAVRGMVWMVLGGLLFSFLNTIARELTLHLDVYQSQFCVICLVCWSSCLGSGVRAGGLICR